MSYLMHCDCCLHWYIGRAILFFFCCGKMMGRFRFHDFRHLLPAVPISSSIEQKIKIQKFVAFSLFFIARHRVLNRRARIWVRKHWSKSLPVSECRTDRMLQDEQLVLLLKPAVAALPDHPQLLAAWHPTIISSTVNIRRIQRDPRGSVSSPTRSLPSGRLCCAILIFPFDTSFVLLLLIPFIRDKSTKSSTFLAFSQKKD